jgi:hypothetical protein
MVGLDAAEAGNVTWSIGDSVAACPAGDTLSTSVARPARLRVAIQYLDGASNPRVGVPPESLYVLFLTVSGNIKANDKAFVTYADDSTNSQGKTMFRRSSPSKPLDRAASMIRPGPHWVTSSPMRNSSKAFSARALPGSRTHQKWQSRR